MKKFALLLVSVLFVLSCNKTLLLDVQEIDFKNKSDVTLTGVPVKADWPMEMRDIVMCDSFLVVKSGGKTNMLNVYSDEFELKDRFCNIGRARNEFISTPTWNAHQILRNAQGDALLPFMTHDEGTKVVDLQKSLAAQRAVMASRNGFTGEYFYEYDNPALHYGSRGILTYGDCIFLDDINHRFEYYDAIILDGEILEKPTCYVTLDSARIKEIKLFKRYKVSDMIYVSSEFFKHPSRNLVVQLYSALDYIMFYDLDRGRNYAIHQVGSLSFDDDYPEVERKEIHLPNGYMTLQTSMTWHFDEVAWAESFFMVTYRAGDYFLNQPDEDTAAPELLFFDYDGNFLKSVKLDTHVSRMTYDEKKHLLYTLDIPTETIYRYDLSELNF